MEFIVLLLTISSNTSSSSESEEQVLAYPLEVGIGAAWLGIRRRFFSGGSGGMLESSGGCGGNTVLWIDGGWNRLSET